MSNNELKEYQVGTTAMQMADMSKINQGTVAIESSRAMVEAQGKDRLHDSVLTGSKSRIRIFRGLSGE